MWTREETAWGQVSRRHVDSFPRRPRHQRRPEGRLASAAAGGSTPRRPRANSGGPRALAEHGARRRWWPEGQQPEVAQREAEDQATAGGEGRRGVGDGTGRPGARRRGAARGRGKLWGHGGADLATLGRNSADLGQRMADPGRRSHQAHGKQRLSSGVRGARDRARVQRMEQLPSPPQRGA